MFTKRCIRKLEKRHEDQVIDARRSLNKIIGSDITMKPGWEIKEGDIDYDFIEDQHYLTFEIFKVGKDSHEIIKVFRTLIDTDDETYLKLKEITDAKYEEYRFIELEKYIKEKPRHHLS